MNAMLRFSRRGGLLLLAAALVYACSDSGPSEPPVPASLQASGVVPGTAVVATVLTPAVRVTDAAGNPVEGTTVTFAVTAGGGSVTSATAGTNSQGVASPGSWTLGTAVGTNTLVASFGSLAPVTITVTATPGVASVLERTSAADQTAQEGQSVAAPPSVRVEDQYGNAVAGATVTFAVTAGGGSVTGATQQTDNAGAATVGSWTLGAAAGANELTASIAGAAPVTFTATGTAANPPAAINPAAGNLTAGTVGTALATAPGVRVTDAGGAPIAGVAVTFSPVAGSGTVLGGVQLTGADGIARPASWTLGTTAGTQTLNAAAGALDTDVSVNATAGQPSTIERASDDDQTAPAGDAVAEAPSVRVEDQYGNAVAGVTVTFAVTTGGGSVTGASPETSASGVATAGTWTLGATPGENTLTASVAGGPSVVFTAVALDASGLGIVKFAGDNTTCPINRDGCVFSVFVTQAGGAPAAGQTVVWSNGSGSTLNTVTNLRGIATAGNIPPNSAVGARTQTATLQTSGSAVTFDYSLVADGGYNIVIRYVGPTPSASVQAAFTQARQRWEGIITGELSNVAFTPAQTADVCEISGLSLDEVVDDLLILAVIDSIDGPSQTLGSAGPCFIRNSNALPIVGLMLLDSADLAVLDGNGRLEDVITHELGHTLGFPSLWGEDYFDLLRDTMTATVHYTGVRAAADFVVAGGTLINDVGVPVENTGAAGTRDSHWRESVLSNELMTGFIGGTDNPLSRITIGALLDLGYQVNFGVADPYLLPGASLRAAGSATAVELRELPMPPPRIVR